MSTKNNNVEIIYKEDFSKEILQNICIYVASNFMQKHFKETIIDNLTYEQDVLKIMKHAIVKYLESNFVFNKGTYKPLASYILKKNYETIFQNLADLLLTEVAHLNTNVIDFLKYYSKSIIIVGEKKYKVPQIKEHDGPIWNVVSLPSMLKEYVYAQAQTHRISKQLQELETQMLSYYINDIDPDEHNKQIEQEINTIENKIVDNTKKIEMIHDSLIIFENDAQSVIKSKEELELVKEQRHRLKERNSELIKQKIKQIKIAEYENLLVKIEAIKREYKQEYLVIKRKEASYLSIRNALVIALSSKKKSL